MVHRLSILVLASAVTVLFAETTFAQTAMLTGTVTGRDGAPLSGALITIDRTDGPGHWRVRTARNGRFVYSGMPVGIFNLTCNVEGNDVDSVNDIRTQSGSTKVVDFDLRATRKKEAHRGSGLLPGEESAAALQLPATYVSAQTPTDQLQLNADNTFSLQAAGETYHGTFVVNGNNIELSIRETGDKTTATIQGSSLTDSSGQTWVRRQQSAETAPGAVTLGNQDVIKMVKAGLDDDLIIAKIGSSKCQFDTSTDALIQLKQSGVSAALLKAVIAAGR
jgi:hypothetical protein